VRGASLSKPRIAYLFGAAIVIAVVIAALTSGLGHGSVPNDAVAKVDDTEISRDGFELALEQAAKRQGLRGGAPGPDDPQYEVLKNEALGDLLDSNWIQGEAEERGIEPTERQVEQQLEQIRKQNFPTEKRFNRFLKQTALTAEDVQDRVRLQVISNQIQQDVSGQVDPSSEGDLEDFYHQNSAQFERPEQRDVRVVLNKSRAKIEQAKALLDEDSSDANWKRVAKKYSTDAATKGKGGLRQGLSKGLGDPALDEVVFSAGQGEIGGPAKSELGYYVFEVVKVTPAGKTSFNDVKAALGQQLDAQRQSEAFSAFIEDYRNKWTERTICAEGFRIDRCDNSEERPTQIEGAPALISAAPAAPGTAHLGLPGTPQGPHPPGEGAPAVPGGLGGGSIPGGIPGIPGGGVSPGAVPPGAP
jgi:parvulin-like peptidyl-prolyl isomerase